MPRLEKDEQLLDKYVREELSAEEEKQFQQRRQDADFEAALQWQKDLQAAAQKSGRQDLKAQVKGWETTASVKKKKRVGYWRWVIITISVVVALLLVWLLLRPDPKSPAQIFAEHFMPYPNIVAPIEKSAERASEETLAYEAYELAAYPQAEVQFAQLEQTRTVQFYRGITALAQEQPAKAIQLLQQVAVTNNRFRQAAEWYLALAHLLQREETEAVTLLQKIESQNEHPFHQRAVELLEDL